MSLPSFTQSRLPCGFPYAVQGHSGDRQGTKEWQGGYSGHWAYDSMYRYTLSILEGGWGKKGRERHAATWHLAWEGRMGG